MATFEQKGRQLNSKDNKPKDPVAAAIQRARAMDARLRLMKERNENYLAERKLEDEADLTHEL